MHDTTSSEPKRTNRVEPFRQELLASPPTALEVRRGLTLRKTKGGILVPRLHYAASPLRDPELNPQWKAVELIDEFESSSRGQHRDLLRFLRTPVRARG
jgi:hypothetical protein